jgi:hypothetical protein
VTGSHRNGTIAVTRVGRVWLSLTESRAEIADVRGDTQVTARSGESRFEGRLGSIALEIDRHRTVIAGPLSAVRVGGATGAVRIEHPRADVRVDVRDASVSMVLDVAVPVAVFTTGRGIDLQIDPQLPVTLDAQTIDGPIIATDFGLSPETTVRGARLDHRIADDAHVALRNQGGEIVIATRK